MPHQLSLVTAALGLGSHALAKKSLGGAVALLLSSCDSSRQSEKPSPSYMRRAARLSMATAAYRLQSPHFSTTLREMVARREPIPAVHPWLARKAPSLV